MDIKTASDKQIVQAINSDSISAADLASRDGWRRICQARGRNIGRVDEQVWQSPMRTSGYDLKRANSRGF